MNKSESYVPKILIVDDRPSNLVAIQKMLKPLKAELVCASSGNEALTLALTHEHFALCLLDVMMPVMDGFETAELLRQNETTEYTPIIFVTAIGKEDQHVFQGYESGAVDYLFKPIEPTILRSKVKVFLDLDRHRWELKQNEETAQALLNAPLDTAILIENNGTILALNRIAAKNLYRDQEGLIGVSLFELLPDELVQLRREKIEIAIRSGRPVRFEDKQGKTVFDNHIYPVVGKENKVNRLAVFAADITKRRQAEDLLVRLAKYDQLTGLANRSMFSSVELRTMARSKRHSRTMAILYIDLDHFKDVNDNLGHDAGDTFLKAVAKRLEQSIRSSDLIARIGGDEFAVILDEINEPEEAGQAAENMLNALSKPFVLNDQKISISASIGIATFSGGDESAEDLNKAADLAMYHAKQQGRNTYQFFSKELQKSSDENRRLRQDLSKALELNELEVFYQPQIETVSGRLSGFEALLRWNHGQHGLISPATFIPLAEESRLINPIGEWVLSHACSWHTTLQDKYKYPPSLSVAVNVSIRQLKQENFCKSVEQLLTKCSIAPHDLEIELTESIIMDDPEEAILMLNHLRSIGVRIALDDFGTGYSSLSYLRKLPIDTVKLDLSFIRDIGVHSESEAIIKAVITLSHNLGLRVVAEGVETAKQTDFLRAEKCDFLQGYYFSRPLQTDAAEKFLREQSFCDLEE